MILSWNLLNILCKEKNIPTCQKKMTKTLIIKLSVITYFKFFLFVKYIDKKNWRKSLFSKFVHWFGKRLYQVKSVADFRKKNSFFGLNKLICANNYFYRISSNLKQLMRLIQKTWMEFSEELAQTLVNSMTKRIENCKAANGDYILY